jgi:outer membrane protein TolC
MKKIIYFLAGWLACTPGLLKAQDKTDTILQSATLNDCVSYALKHQPSVQQFRIDEEITENNIRNRLADWYPQVSLAYSLQHNIQLPTAFLPDANGNKRPVTTGVKNTSNVQFNLSQNIFNRDVLLATRSAESVREQSRQLSTGNRIDVAVAVSKAYYDLLVTQQQVKVFDENIVRLERSLKDAYDKYEGGIADKIDYKRAQIALNTTRADRKKAFDAIEGKRAYLKELMGYPAANPLSVLYDSMQMERDVPVDTLVDVQITNRIEYRELLTQQRLLQYNLRYTRWSYLPSVSAIGSYNPTFQNDRFTSLYGSVYPSSFVGLQLTLPLFQGGKRLHNIRIAELQLDRLQLQVTALTDQINTQYAQALAGYKGNLAELIAIRDNLALAEDVYTTLRLQYNAGIKTYLDVIIAETDLRTAQLSYLNALYQVLSSKLDLQRATGTISY